MLKQRIITASILAIAVVSSLFLLPSLWFAGLFGIPLLLAAWEWAGLCGYRKNEQRYIYVLVVLSVGIVLMLLTLQNPMTTKYVLIVACAWWIMALVGLLGGKSDSPLFVSPTVKLISGALLLVAVLLSVYYLHKFDDNSPAALFFLFMLVWLADSGAYIAGKLWGKTKLAPSVSPGKTIEGLFGGIVAVSLFSLLVGYFYVHLSSRALLLLLLTAVVATLFSVLGDLVESKYKRIAGIKDSGQILPGHGGILDRIDGFAAAAPVFTLCWLSILNKGAL